MYNIIILPRDVDIQGVEMQALKDAYRNYIIICIATGAAILIFALLLGFKVCSIPIAVAPIENFDMIRIILLVVAGADAASVFILKKPIAESIKNESDPEQRLKKLLSGAIVIFAVSVSPAVFGVIDIILGDCMAQAKWFFVIAVISIYLGTYTFVQFKELSGITE